MVTKARQLAEFIANADVDSDEIATGAVSASKLADTLDLSSKTIVMPDVAAFNITSDDVGIGTSVPTNKLHVNSGTTNVVAKFESTDAGAYISLTDTTGTSSIATEGQYLYLDVDKEAVVASSQMRFRVDGSTKLTINDSGKVGIGTTSPAESLDIAGGSIRIGNSKIRHSGSGGSWDMAFETYSGGYFERMRIDSVGNVGVGTTSPDIYSFGGKILSVNGGTSYTNLVLAGDTNTGIAFGTSSARLGQITMDSTNGLTLYSQGTGNGQTMTLDRSGNVGINSANPVSKLDVQYGSLGTWEGASSTPTLVVGQNDAYRGISLRTVGDSNVGPSFHFERTRASGGTTSDNDKLGQIVFNGTSGGYTDRIAAEIAVIQDGTAAAGWVPGTIQFKTTSVASSSSNTHIPRMTIKTDGNIEFTNGGTRAGNINYKQYAYYFDYAPTRPTWADTTEAGNNALSHALMVRTPVRDSSNVAAIVIAENGGQATGKNGLWFRNEDFNSGVGYTKAKIYTEVGNNYNATNFYIDVANSSQNSANRLQIDQNGTFYGSSSNNISDRRLKENIETITNPIEKIKGLTGRTFMWTEESTKADGKTKYGFIAQEVDTVVPDLVEKETGLTYFDDNNNIVEKHESTNAAMSVNETGVIPILVEALKEALTEIEELKARIEALEG